MPDAFFDALPRLNVVSEVMLLERLDVILLGVQILGMGFSIRIQYTTGQSSAFPPILEQCSALPVEY